MVIAVIALSGMGVVVIAIVFSSIALGQSTTQFASFQKEISSIDKWMDIKPCLYKSMKGCTCTNFQHKYANHSAHNFFATHLTPIESGCCKPPMECDFNFSSPTVWIKPENKTNTNSDCHKWNNHPKKLCYNCQACKHGFARDLKKPWTIAGAVVLVASLLIILAILVFLVVDKLQILRN
ncbi:hypothetical protein SOVF_181400 [Spinacia oleracea]|nr:hypothetical protein SOVF_181400 [Spinacia oleracea]